MLQRVWNSNRTKEALASRDFAAVGTSHELRTPLTAMRTNLEVLSVHPGSAHDQRKERSTTSSGTQTRIEATLMLERLAQGELSTSTIAVPVDITDSVPTAPPTTRPDLP